MIKHTEVMKLALEGLEIEDMACRYEKEPTPEHITKAITALREALASEAIEQPAQQKPDWLDKEQAETDWDHVWLLIKAASYASSKGFISGTTNWGSAVSRYMRNESPQPAQQEPVAWGKPTDEMVQAATDEYDEWANENKGTTECIRAMLSKALKASPQAQPAQQEPVKTQNEFEQWCASSGHDYCFDLNEIGEYQWADAQGAYEAYWARNTFPPQRTWVGLTFEEVREIFQKMFDVQADWPDFADAIEAKLKEKNGITKEQT